MSQSNLRIIILITGLFTALVHLVLLSVLIGSPAPQFILNGIGYLVLLALFWFNPSFVAGNRGLLHYAFMGFTAVTIIAWIAIGDKSDPVGYLTKLSEVILLVALWMNLRRENAAAAG